MANRYRFARRFHAAQKSTNFVSAFCYLFQPVISFAQVVSSTPAETSSDASPAATPGSGTVESGTPPILAPSIPSSSGASDSGSSAASSGITDTTGSDSLSAASTPTSPAQTTTPASTDSAPSLNTIQPLLATQAPGDGTESADLAHKAIDPKYYSETDPVTDVESQLLNWIFVDSRIVDLTLNELSELDTAIQVHSIDGKMMG